MQFEKDKFAYVYLPRVIDGNEYKAVESLYQSDGVVHIKRETWHSIGIPTAWRNWRIRFYFTTPIGTTAASNPHPSL